MPDRPGVFNEQYISLKQYIGSWSCRCVEEKPSPSRDIPTARHFLNRHCWQRFRFMRMIVQFSDFMHFLYWIFCWMLLRKKPWRFQQAHKKFARFRLRYVTNEQMSTSTLIKVWFVPYLATFTSVDAVMKSRSHVAAHFTQHHHAVQL